MAGFRQRAPQHVSVRGARTDGLNQAIAWAAENGYARVRLPTGTYLVGTKQSDVYWGGIELESSVALVMDDETVIQMAPTDTWNYCVVAVTGKHDVLITGGAFRTRASASPWSTWISAKRPETEP